jgi:hypothetical protein
MNDFHIHELPANFDPYRDPLPFHLLFYGGAATGKMALIILFIGPFCLFGSGLTLYEALMRSGINWFMIGFSIYGLIIGGVMTVFALNELLRFIQAVFKWRQLVQSGVLLTGYIEKASSSSKKAIKKGKYNKYPNPPYWMNLEVIYSFDNPSGKHITGSQKEPVPRYTLPRQLPEPGTPVTILYASDYCHFML